MKGKMATKAGKTTFNSATQEHKPFFRYNPRTICGITLLSLLFLMALLAPIIAPFYSSQSPLNIDLFAINLGLGAHGHLLGTDYLGRDILSEALWGARASLTVGIAAACLAVSFGTLWGGVSAMLGGIVDEIMMRVVDGLLAIPAIILLLVFQSLCSASVLAHTLPEGLLHLLRVTSYSQGLLPFVTTIFVISASCWLEAARLAHSQVLAIQANEYITAAKALGISKHSMFFKHLLPNTAFVVVLEATLLVSDAVLMEAGLSFLGLGLGPGIPSWGSMITAAPESLLQGNFLPAIIPGILISLCVISVNLLGEGFVDITHSTRRAAGRLAL
jgi:peptide/nickel transport system permease protein